MINYLEYYRYFYYVGCYKSFTSAAEKLCISQPAISQSIRMLEKKIGCQLFLRTSKGVKLTPEGEILFTYVKQGMECLEKGESMVEKIMKYGTGEIQIGASDMTLQFFLLPFLETFHEKYPEVKVKVTNGPTPETLENLYAGKIDFGIVSSPFDMRDEIIKIDVREMEDCFVVGSQMAELAEKTLDLKVLEDMAVICLETNSSTRRYLDQFLKNQDVVLKPEFELATSNMIVQFALRNLGIGCVMKDFAKKELDAGNLYELKFNHQIPKRNFSLIYSKNVPMSLAAQKLVGMIVGE